MAYAPTFGDKSTLVSTDATLSSVAAHGNEKHTATFLTVSGLPTASASTLGCIKLGAGLTDSGGGVIEVTGGTPGVHNLIDTVNHPVAGLTTGHFLKATGATTYGFAVHGLTASDVSAIADPGSSTDREVLTWNGTTGDAIRTSVGVSVDSSGHLISNKDVVAYASGYSGLSGYTFRYSLVADGSYNVNLVNDVVTPGANKIYGTDSGGTRGWITAPTSMTYPDAGIPISTGSAWTTSITNNSVNWNTAYGWGNHASAGYAVKANNETISGTWSFEGNTSYTGGFYSGWSKYDFLINNGGWLVLGSDKSDYKSYVGWSGSGKYLDFGIEYYTDPTYFLFRGKDASGTVRTLAKLISREGCEFYYTGTKRLETTSVGATITGKIYVNDSNSVIEEGSGNTIKITSDSGYTEIGPQNATYSHFYTDRASYYFDSKIYVDEGIISSYDEDLVLKRADTTKLTIASSSATFENTVYSKGDVIAYSA